MKRNQKEIEALQERLGWRVQVTNVPAKKLPLVQCVRTYREGWSLERDFHLVKDKPLGISPLYVKKDEQILGLTRLLTIGLRALTWLEIRVREELRKRKEELVQQFPGAERNGRLLNNRSVGEAVGRGELPCLCRSSDCSGRQNR